MKRTEKNSKGTREFENEDRAARKRLDNLRRRRKPLERD